MHASDPSIPVAPDPARPASATLRALLLAAPWMLVASGCYAPPPIMREPADTGDETSSSTEACDETTEAPPTTSTSVVITSPADGEMFDVGAMFHIAVMVSDDLVVSSVQLYAGNNALQADDTEPYGWDVADIPQGVYELTVVATDSSGNESTSDPVTVYVGVEPPAPEGC